MILREVFFVVSLSLLVLSSNAVQAFTITSAGEIAGGECTSSLILAQQSRWRNWSFGGTLTLEHTFQQVHMPMPAWELKYNGEGIVLEHWRGMPHFSEPSLFRVLNKNQFTNQTAVVAACFRDLSCGSFLHIPLDDEKAHGAFALFEKSLGPCELIGLNLIYDTEHGSNEGRTFGRVAVLQGGLEGSLCQAELAVGWHWAGRERPCRGLVWTSGLHTGKSAIELQYVEIDPEFTSLFSSTNRFTPDRKGWEMRLQHELPVMNIGLTLRSHSSIDGQHSYPRVSLDTQITKLNYSAELRLQPTRALILKWKGSHSSWQIDPIRQTFRVDWDQAKASNRVTIDYPFGLVRFQTDFDFLGSWRVVYKRDFQKGRSNFFARTQIKRGNGVVQLEWGAYDRGNIRAAFDRDPVWRISWEYEF